MARHRRFYCVGDSQLPLIPHGTAVESEVIDSHRIENGDLLIFMIKHSYACHRVLWKKREDGLNWFFMKGDNNPVADGWVPETHVVGKVIRIQDRLVRDVEAGFSFSLFWYSRLHYLGFYSLFLSPLGKKICRWCRRVGFPPLASYVGKFTAPRFISRI